MEITPLNNLSVHLQKLVKDKLWLQVLIGIVLGAVLGLILNPSSGFVSQSTSTWLSNWLDVPGNVFLKLVQMIMIPLIVTSIISGIISNTTENLKSFGLKLLLYFIFTTTVAIGIGVLITLVMEPGTLFYSLGGFPVSEQEMVQMDDSINAFKSLPEALSNLIPSNPLQALVTGEMLSVVIFTIIIGIAITQLHNQAAAPLVKLFASVQKICMIVVGWAMVLVPYAVFGLIAALLARTGLEVFYGLGYYMLVVIIGLVILLLFYMLLIGFLGKTNPFSFLAAIREPQLLAFSTASSAAVMPLSMKVADEKLGVASHVSDFVIPVGASINMDGTALFQCVTALFMAQAYGIELTLVNLILITVTVVAASIGTPAVPGGGVIILASVLQSTGIPVDGLIVIIGIDRILGMFRTAVNVTGDLTACVIFNKWYGKVKS